MNEKSQKTALALYRQKGVFCKMGVRMRYTGALVFLVVLRWLPIQCQEKQILITQDFMKAKEISQGYQKPLVLVFTGSDWCQYSQDLLKNTFFTEPFFQTIKTSLIFAQIDFPELSRVVLPERIEQNKILKDQFKVQEFPTVILMDPAMHEVTRLGFSTMPSNEYAKYLVLAWDKYKSLASSLESKKEWTFEQLQAAYKEAEELGSDYLMMGLLTLGLYKDKDCFFHLEKYCRSRGEARKELRKQILSLNSDHRQDIALQLAVLDYQETVEENSHVELARLLKDIDTIEVNKGGLYEKNLGWRVNRLLAQQLVLEGEFEAASVYAKKSLYLAPDRYQREVSQLIQQISLKLPRDQEVAMTK